jgi:hypothetical protein
MYRNILVQDVRNLFMVGHKNMDTVVNCLKFPKNHMRLAEGQVNHYAMHLN